MREQIRAAAMRAQLNMDFIDKPGVGQDFVREIAKLVEDERAAAERYRSVLSELVDSVERVGVGGDMGLALALDHATTILAESQR